MNTQEIVRTVFPGTNKEVTLQEVEKEISDALRRIEEGDFEEIEL